MNDKVPDWILGITSTNRQAKYKLYVQGYCWEHDDSFEKTDQQKSDFHIAGEVWPTHWDFIAVQGSVNALNIPTGDNAKYTIDGQNASKQEVLNHGTGSSGSATDSPTDASGTFSPPEGTDTGQRVLDAKHGVVNRALETARDNPQTIGGGGDIGTVQGGVNSWPRFIEHDANLHLEKGTHSNEPGDSVNIPFTPVASAHGSAKIVGDKNNPEDYVIEARQLNFAFGAGTCQNVGLEGVTIKGTVQARRGNLEIDSCRLIAGQRWGKGDAVPLDTYEGTVQILDSELRGDGATINFVEDATVSVDGDTVLDAGGPLASSGQSGGTLSFSGEADVRCPRLTDETWDQSVVEFKDPHEAVKGIPTGGYAVVEG